MQSALVWFRRDLRHFDHAALSHALRNCERVHCAFVFDREFLDPLPTRADRRVAFIWHSVRELDALLAERARECGVRGAGLLVRHARADEAIPELAAALGVQHVFANRDYEPDALARDARVAQRLHAAGIGFTDFKDQVIFERDEVLTAAGTPFSVFTPYRKAWLARLDERPPAPHPVAEHAARLAPKAAGERVPTLAEIGFAPAGAGASHGVSGGHARFQEFAARIDDYHVARDFPAREGGSRLSTHLRFGTVSIRGLVAFARAQSGPGARAWLDELIWRDFYQMILWHHPRVVTASFKPQFDRLAWACDDALFAAWCEARTGYPIIDAAMRQLNTTGFMHNRLRMLAASFLTKDLGIDWRRGERYFAARLDDYDLAANNGGWQWAASTGCDAQPWFRIFNPVTQSQRFDADGTFIRRHVPELAGVPDRFIHAPWRMDAAQAQAAGVCVGRDYPQPLVDHAEARVRTLARFAALRGEGA